VSAPILPGAEPYVAEGDRRGVLLLHGFTGDPSSMRGLAVAMADAGMTVELPLLPGHGTSVSDLLPKRWSDWVAEAKESYNALAARCDGVVVAGLSMGGVLALWLAERHPEIAGMVLVNPQVMPPDDTVYSLVTTMLDAGEELGPGIGGDIAKEGVVESSYTETPLRPLLSLFTGIAEVYADIESVSCPVLLFTSHEDHIVDPMSSEVLVTRLGCPVEQVRLERSYHVATLDWDREEIEARSVEFASTVLSTVTP
jgi:carboxylesterase